MVGLIAPARVQRKAVGVALRPDQVEIFGAGRAAAAAHRPGWVHDDERHERVDRVLALVLRPVVVRVEAVITIVVVDVAELQRVIRTGTDRQRLADDLRDADETARRTGDTDRPEIQVIGVWAAGVDVPFPRRAGTAGRAGTDA